VKAVYLGISTCLLAFLFLITPNAVSGGDSGGCSLDLEILPDAPVGAGDKVSITLSEGHEDNWAFIVVGYQLGTTQLHGWDLDLIPSNGWYFDQFPSTGELTVTHTLPTPLPPFLSGATLHIQGVSVGQGCCGLSWAESNLDKLEFL